MIIPFETHLGIVETLSLRLTTADGQKIPLIRWYLGNIIATLLLWEFLAKLLGFIIIVFYLSYNYITLYGMM